MKVYNFANWYKIGLTYQEGYANIDTVILKNFGIITLNNN